MANNGKEMVEENTNGNSRGPIPIGRSTGMGTQEFQGTVNQETKKFKGAVMENNRKI